MKNHPRDIAARILASISIHLGCYGPAWLYTSEVKSILAHLPAAGSESDWRFHRQAAQRPCETQ